MLTELAADRGVHVLLLALLGLIACCVIIEVIIDAVLSK